MALPASGAISMNQVNVELGLSGTAQISLNDSAVRTLFGVASGAISLNDGHGKSNAFAGTISTNQQEINLRTWALANGWNGTSAATITVGSGVYIWSDNTATPALTINGSWPGGLTLVNNGFIMGKGGAGGDAGPTSGYPGAAGGAAISLGVNTTISSSAGYIAGGGGGGGGSGGNGSGYRGGGGGAGGGNGGSSGYAPSPSPPINAGGGGRILPGSPTLSPGVNGTKWGSTVSGYTPGLAGATAPGGYGSQAVSSGIVANVSAGAPGGPGLNGDASSDGGGIAYGGGSRGGIGTSISGAGGGGGGWGAVGGHGGPGSMGAGGAGGAGGNAVALNGYSVSWTGGFPSAYIFGAVS